MEENKTIQYKRTLRASVGAGMGALFNGSGRRFYILEHRDGSKYHKVGESQKIIIDQIELGCNANCQVRFDQETWGIVSRRHAAIQRDGNQWKLMHLSTVNSTLVNGHKIEKEWFLKNGDEIQLAVGGPRLGFIVNPGKQSLVSSIKLNERIKLFEKQALRPYRRAIVAMAVVFVLLISGLGAWNYLLQDTVQKQESRIVQLSEISDSLEQVILEQNKQIKGNEKQIAELSTRAAIAVNTANRTNSDFKNFVGLTATKDIQACYPNVYFVEVTLNNIVNEKGKPAQFHGTAFLLSDGRLVTAQHMVDFWSVLDYTYVKDSLGNTSRVVDLEGGHTYLNVLAHNGKPIDITWDAYSPTGDHKQYKYTSESCPFTIGVSNTKKSSLSIIEGIQRIVVEKNFGVSGADWAYIQTGKKGGLAYDKTSSKVIPAKTRLDILGYPYARGGENKNKPQPIYSESTVARDGIDSNGTIMLSNEDTQGGNSGGPAFIKKDGKLMVVGILTGSSGGKDCLVPIANIK